LRVERDKSRDLNKSLCDETKQVTTKRDEFLPKWIFSVFLRRILNHEKMKQKKESSNTTIVSSSQQHTTTKKTDEMEKR